MHFVFSQQRYLHMPSSHSTPCTDSYAVQVLGNKMIELVNMAIRMWTFFCNFCFHELLTCWIKLSLNLNQKSSLKKHTPRPKARMKEKKSPTCWMLKIKRKSKEKKYCANETKLHETKRVELNYNENIFMKRRKNEKSTMKERWCRIIRKKAFHAQINE